MTESRNYRDQAPRIRAIAADRDDGEVKMQFLKIADLFEHLADIADKHGDGQ
jgi:hypothetical protein